MPNASVRAGRHERPIDLLGHRHAPVPSQEHPSPHCERQPQDEENETDALNGRDSEMLEDSVTDDALSFHLVAK